LRLLATPADGFPRIDGALLAWRVERALRWRKALGLPGPDHAYRLIHGAGDGLPGDGLLWLAANTHELGSLAKLAQKGLRLANRSAAIVEQGGLPPEYPTLAAQPHDRYLQVCLLRLA